MHTIKIIDARDIETGIEVLPNKNGVYAWFKRLTFDSASPESFKRTVEESLEPQFLMPLYRGIVRPLSQVHTGSPLIRRKYLRTWQIIQVNHQY